VQYLSVPIAYHHRNSLKLHHDLFPLAHKNLNHLQGPGENKVLHFEVQVRPIILFCNSPIVFERSDAYVRSILFSKAIASFSCAI
jgi:hypothetical protein